MSQIGRWGQLEAPLAVRPLSGRSPEQVVSQLIYHLFGPKKDDVKPMLDLHGLAGRPATHKRATGLRNGVPEPQLRSAQRHLTAEAQRSRIDETILCEASRPTGPFEDHQSRVCIARTLGVPKPAPWRITFADSHAAGNCLDIVTIVGPLSLTSLAGAIRRIRLRRPTPIPTDAELALLLIESELLARGLDGQWRPKAHRPERVSYRKIADAVGDRVLTRSQCTDLLLNLGYAQSSAERQGLDRQPMIERITPRQYALIGHHDRSNPTRFGPASALLTARP
jgi:hypothetical protein